MNDRNRNLLVRFATAVVLLPLVLLLLGVGGWWCAALVAFAAGVCSLEYQRITVGDLGSSQVLAVVGAAAIPLAAAWRPESFAAVGFWILGGVCFAAWVELLLSAPRPDGPGRAAHAVTGCLYGGLGLAPVAALRLRPDGLQWVIAALVITWANDTCAYFVGRLLGRHKMAPAISPNKTWEGFAGGMVGSVAGMFVARAVAFPGLTAIDCWALGLAGGVLGPLGDLCESQLKRAYQIKDSGRIIPGHGGLLDRVDALLFNAPAVYLYVTVVRGLLTPAAHGAL